MYELKGLFSARKSMYCEPEIYFRLVRELKTSNCCIIVEICKTNRFVFNRCNANSKEVATHQPNRAVQVLIQFDKWDQAAIEKRHEMMVKLVRKVWEMPERSKETAE